MNRNTFAIAAFAGAILLSPVSAHTAEKLTSFQKKVAAVMKMDHRSALTGGPGLPTRACD